MSKNRDDEPAYIFCNAETKEDEYSKRYRGYHTYDYFGPKEEKDDPNETV